RSRSRRGTPTSTDRASREPFTSWDWPMASNRSPRPVRSSLIAVLAVVSMIRAEAPEGETAMTLALPGGKAAEVAISLGEGAVTLDLPAEAVLPKDFASATGGLVRSGAVSARSDSRVRLDLILAGASLS